MKSIKSKKKCFDLIVVGGGISSLYLVYLLSKQKSWLNKKIVVLEKENYFGGRLKVYKTKMQGMYYEWDEGCARYNQNHILLRKLINDIGLKKNVVEIGANIDFMPSKQKYDPDLLKMDPNKLMQKILNAMKKEKKDVLINTNFITYAPTILTKKEVQYIIDSFGYYAELERMNAYDFYRLIKFDMSTDNSKFFALTSKLGSVIPALMKKIKQSKMYKKGNILFKKSQQVERIHFDEKTKIFTIKSFESFSKKYSIWQSKKCVCALPQKALKSLSILKPIEKLLDSVNCIPLCRIYSIYKVPKKSGKIWFEFMKGKVSTNNPIRFIIPVDKKKGVIMISYTDDKYANYWGKMANNKKKLDKTIQRFTQEWVPKGVKVPKPIFTKVSYWDCGIAYWKKGVNSKKVYDKIIHPYYNIPLYICGENYSMHQAWSEGALQTAKDVYTKVI